MSRYWRLIDDAAILLYGRQGSLVRYVVVGGLGIALLIFLVMLGEWLGGLSGVALLTLSALYCLLLFPVNSKGLARVSDAHWSKKQGPSSGPAEKR